MVSVRIITREIGEFSKACKDFLKNLAVFTIFSRFSRHCYHLDLVKYSDNVYAVHICCDADYRFGLGSGFISMSLNTWDEFFNHDGLRLNVEGYDVVTIFRSSGLFLVT